MGFLKMDGNLFNIPVIGGPIPLGIRKSYLCVYCTMGISIEICPFRENINFQICAVFRVLLSKKYQNPY